jgi:hypothetical protein
MSKDYKKQIAFLRDMKKLLEKHKATLVVEERQGEITIGYHLSKGPDVGYCFGDAMWTHSSDNHIKEVFQNGTIDKDDITEQICALKNINK